MKSKKFLAVGLCGMVAVGLAQGASAATGTSDNPVPVTYDYTGTAEPVDPKYGVSIPTGLVFNAKSPDTPLDVTVSIKPAPGETSINGACSAKVSVKSANEYQVKLADGSDAVNYVVKYGDTVLTGAASIDVGTLVKNATGAPDNEKIVGSAKLSGVATKTGAHTDTLTYTITNVAIS